VLPEGRRLLLQRQYGLISLVEIILQLAKLFLMAATSPINNDKKIFSMKDISMAESSILTF